MLKQVYAYVICIEWWHPKVLYINKNVSLEVFQYYVLGTNAAI